MPLLGPRAALQVPLSIQKVYLYSLPPFSASQSAMPDLDPIADQSAMYRRPLGDAPPSEPVHRVSFPLRPSSGEVS
eukprot:9479233-Pyramimonas_sp.AAC.1